MWSWTFFFNFFRVSGIENEPPYAVLNSQDFEEEESEEGYETIPASERRSNNVRKDSHEVTLESF